MKRATFVYRQRSLFSTKSVLADGRNPHFVRVKSFHGEILALLGVRDGFNFTEHEGFDFTNGISH